jgi:hypothetical protein
MSTRSHRLRTTHRLHMGFSAIVLLTLGILNLTGVLDRGTALLLFVLIEMPLLLVFAVLTILRFRRPRRLTRGDVPGFLDRLVAEEPLLRPVAFEIRAFQSLVLALTGRRRVPEGAVPFGYTRGMMTLPVALAVVSLVEVLVVHLLVPWLWLRILLLLLSVWGVLFLFGFLATRVVHPHFVAGDVLHLRWGRTMVLTAPLSAVAAAVRHAHHTDSHPRAEDGLLVLSQFQSTNVRLRFTDPVPARPPVAAKDRPADFRASEVLLHVDDPERFLQLLSASREPVVR